MPLKKFQLPQPWVLTIAFLTLMIPLLILEYPLLQYSNGLFVYPQDEAYIRMATAKNLAFHGSWGLSGEQFNAASSSILYPLILAVLFKLFGTHLVIPFLINLMMAIAFLILVQRWLLKQGLSPLGQLLVLAAIILLTPLHVLIATGMEPMLQVLLTLLFFFQFCAWLNGKHRHLTWNIYLLGLLLTATRYEGLFVIFVACLVLLIKCRPLLCLTFGLVSVLPVVLFGIYSLQKGGYFLPTSIMLKAMPVPLNMEAIGKFFKEDIFTRLVYPYTTRGAIAATRILIVLPLVYWLFLPQMRVQGLYRRMLLCFLAVTFLHLTFASVVLFYRYEAYLIACMVLITGVLITRDGRSVWPSGGAGARWIAVWMGLFLLYPFFSRGWVAHTDTFTACLNTYEQNYQAAGFIHQFYDNAVVVTDNIGAASYLSDGKKIDLISGIGYTEIARAREGSYFQVSYAHYLVKNEQPALAVIEENRYSYELLKPWVKVADWYTNNKVILRSDHLSFYALDSSSSPGIKEKLRAYESSLPAGVKVNYP